MYCSHVGTEASAEVTGKGTTTVFAKQDTQAKTVRKVSMSHTELHPAMSCVTLNTVAHSLQRQLCNHLMYGLDM